MSNINIKSILSILAGKITLFISKNLLKGGSTFPGTVALKFDKEILKKVAKGYKVILVTGTNSIILFYPYIKTIVYSFIWYR